jgi:hypothetical protein
MDMVEPLRAVDAVSVGSQIAWSFVKMVQDVS